MAIKEKSIIFIHLLNDFSGSPKVLSQIINSVSKSEYKIDLYKGSSSEGFLSKTAANTFNYWYKRSNNKILTLLSLFISQVLLAIKLLKYRNKDVIIYVNTLLPFGAAIMGSLMNKPVIYHIHETYIRPKIFKQFLRTIVSITASKIIFVSKSLKELEKFRVIKQKVIYNSLTRKFSEQAATHKYCPFDKKEIFNVYMIASLRSYKGLNEFVEIARKCLKNSSLNFVLILNASQIEIETYFKNIFLPSNINILPTQQDLHQHYINAGLVLNLSLVDKCIETFGLTIIEAMSYGIPVIAPPIGGPLEIVEDNVDGFLISSYNTEQIANKIEELYQNNSLCMRLSQNAKLKSKIYDEATFNEQIIELLND